MKIQCIKCKEIVELTDFSTSDEGLHIRCSSCAGEFFIANPKRGSTPEVVESAEPPKEIPSRKGTESPEAKPPPSIPAPAEGEASGLWAMVLKDYENENRHRAYLEYCTRTMTLGEAALNYRRLRDERGGDNIAERYLNQIPILAQQAYLRRNASSSTSPPSALKLSLIFVGAILFVALLTRATCG